MVLNSLPNLGFDRVSRVLLAPWVTLLAFALPAPASAFENLLPELQRKILMELPLTEHARMIRVNRSMRKVALSEAFYNEAVLSENSPWSLQRRVQFAHLRVLEELTPTRFADFKWRTWAVHLLLDPRIQFAPIPNSKSPYQMQRTPVTQLLWALVEGKNPAHFNQATHCPAEYTEVGEIKLCPRLPVENVSWDDITRLPELNYLGVEEDWEKATPAFLFRLREEFGIEARLPSQADWVASAQNLFVDPEGHATPVMKSWKTTMNLAWGTYPVGQFKEHWNSFGFADLSTGNVAERLDDQSIFGGDWFSRSEAVFGIGEPRPFIYPLQAINVVGFRVISPAPNEHQFLPRRN